MSCNTKPNYSINIQYVLNCLAISLTESSYKSGITIPHLELGFSTLKNILSGNGRTTKSGKVVSEKKIQQITNAFSLLLRHPEERRIVAEDLDLDPKDFSAIFPPTAFLQMDARPTVKREIFMNKLYRCYYMPPDSPHRAFLAYFKLIDKGSHLEAYMVRGIQDWSLAQDIKNHFEMPEQLEQCIYNKKHEKKEKEGKNGKEIESIYLYKASNDESHGHRREEISFTPNHIQIHFHSVEDTPCYSTMYWDISAATRMKLDTYIGGTAFMVNSNDGRKRNISSFKMGLEAIENIPSSQRAIVEQGPLVSDAPQLINELVLKSKHGVMTLDESDDQRWYRFIQNTSYREKVYDRHADVDIHALMESLIHFRTEYEQQFLELRSLIQDLKNSNTQGRS